MTMMTRTTTVAYALILWIETPDGHFAVVHVPDAVQRLDEVKLGNGLTITETELVLIDLAKGADAGAIGLKSQSSVVRDPGEKPSGMLTDSVTVTGVVQAVDEAGSSVTIMGPETTMTFTVLLFGEDTPQTFAGYRYLLAHLSALR